MIKLILLLFIALIIVAVKFLPWWALLIVAVLAIVSFKYFVRWVFLMPFKMKGAVLHGAKLEVHSVQATPKPAKPTKAQKEKSDDDEAGEAGEADEEDEEDEEDDSEPDSSKPELPRDYYWVEATLTPDSAAGKSFKHWEPGELIVSRPGRNPMDDQSDDVGELDQLQVFENGVFKPDQGMKYPDAQRLRLLLAVLPELREVQLNYYFETLGSIRLK